MSGSEGTRPNPETVTLEFFANPSPRKTPSRSTASGIATGLGCPHWPLCTANAIPLDQKASFIEYSHRAVAALLIVLVAAVAVRAWLSYRSRPDVLWPALAAVVLVPLQAVLGAVAVWLKLPGWVVAFHFVVGMLFLGTIVYTAAAAWRRTERPATPGFTRLAWGTILVGFALMR